MNRNPEKRPTTMFKIIRTTTLALLALIATALPSHAQQPPVFAVPLPAVQPLLLPGVLPAYQPALLAISGTAAAGLGATTSNTTGSSFLLSNNALLTGTGFEFSHTTSVLADGGSLARFGSTSVDTGGATHGTLLDLSSTAATAATLVELNDSALTTGRGIFATHTSGVLTTGSLLRLTNTTADTGSGQGTLLDLSSTGCATCAVVQLAANALTTGVGMIIPHTTSVIASGGSLLRISSTSVDTGTTTGNLLDLSASGSVAGSLVNIAASTASQTTETALSITQSGTAGGYTGNFVSFTGSSTTGSGNLFALTTVNTTGGSAESITANSVTTSTAGVLALSATGLTSGTGMKITGSAPATMTAAGSFVKINDGTNDVFRIGQNGVIITTQTSAPTVASVGDGSTGACSGCTDTRGVATDTTAANTNAVIITFNTTRTPVACTVSPGNANTAVDLKAAGGGILTLGAGTLSISAPSGNWGANAKAIDYICFY